MSSIKNPRLVEYQFLSSISDFLGIVEYQKDFETIEYQIQNILSSIKFLGTYRVSLTEFGFWLTLIEYQKGLSSIKTFWTCRVWILVAYRVSPGMLDRIHSDQTI